MTAGAAAAAEFAARAGAACARVEAEGIDAAETGPEAVQRILAVFVEAGLLELDVLQPEAEAVSSSDLYRICAAMRGLAGQSGTLASIYMVAVALGGACLALGGSAEQKASLLPRLRQGRLQLAFALTEPEAGSDAAAIATSASPLPDGGHALRGDKIYITGAASADLIITAARMAGSAEKRAVSLFLVPGGSPGLQVEAMPKLSLHAHASCRLRFEDVRLPPAAALGGPERLGGAWAVLRATGTLERLVVTALALGLAEAIVARATGFARDRRQFGRAIAEFQAIQHALVEMHTTVTAMDMFLDRALAAMAGGGDATAAVSMAKSFTAEQLQDVAAKGMRVLGGRAFFEFEPMARWYREAPFSLYAGGTIEVQKMLVARALGLP